MACMAVFVRPAVTARSSQGVKMRCLVTELSSRQSERVMHWLAKRKGACVPMIAPFKQTGNKTAVLNSSLPCVPKEVIQSPQVVYS